MKSSVLKTAAPLLLAAVTGFTGFLAGQHQVDSNHQSAALPRSTSTAKGLYSLLTPQPRGSASTPAAVSLPDGSIESLQAWLAALEKSLPPDAATDVAAVARLLLRHWQPALSPDKAWAQASALPHSAIRGLILERLWPDLAAADPDAGWQASFLLASEVSSAARLQLANDWLAAGRNGADLAPLLNASPENEREQAAATAMVALTAHSTADALQTAAAITDEQTRLTAHLTIAAEWAKTDPSAAAAWSLDHAGEAPGGLGAVMQQWAASDVTAASAWLAAQPAGPARDAAAPALVESLVYSDIASAREWARGITDETARAGMLQRLDLAAQAQ